jgi:hypothetical protein
VAIDKIGNVVVLFKSEILASLNNIRIKKWMSLSQVEEVLFRFARTLRGLTPLISPLRMLYLRDVAKLWEMAPEIQWTQASL